MSTQASANHKSRRRRKRHSMRNQIAMLFIGLLLLSIFAITAINGIFLEKYYVSKKSDVLLEIRESLNEMDFTPYGSGQGEIFSDGTEDNEVEL